MKNFILRTLLILAPIIVIGLVVESMYEEEPWMYFEKSSYLKQNSNDIEILFMGNSSMFTAVIPDLVHSKSYNIGLPTEPPIRTLTLANKLSDDHINIHTVVIGLNYLGLFVGEAINSKNDRNYWHFFGLPPKSKIESSSAFGTIPPEQIVYQIKRRLSLITQSDRDDDRLWIPSNKGHYYRESKLIDLEEMALKMITQQTAKTNKMNLESNLNQIPKLIDSLESKGIKVVLLRLPNYATYYQLQDENIESLHDQAVHQIVDNCNSCEYIDYSNDTSFQKVRYFSDPFHMSLDGAKAFSVDLKNRLF